MKILAVLLALSLLAIGQAYAEVRVGVLYAPVSFTDKDIKDTLDNTTVTVPYVAVGGEVATNMFAYVEAGPYSLEAKGKESDGTYDTVTVSGATIMAVLAPRFDTVELRLGYGIITADVDVKVSSQADAFFASLGLSNYEQKFDTANGTQFMFGAAFLIGESLSIGVEIRNITLTLTGEESAEVPGLGRTSAKLDDVEAGQQWQALNVAIRF